MSTLEAMFDDSRPVAGVLSDQTLAEIPARRGVVLLTAADDQPILLMTAGDMRSRLRNRLAEPAEEGASRRADLREITERVYWRRTCSHFETDLHCLMIARAVYPDSFPDYVSTQPAWFVTIDAQAAPPVLSATRRTDPGGVCLGPFASKRAAEGFIADLVDGFDLCRCQHILRQAPRGPACAYKQMGRCLAPCDGSGSMDAYRRRVEQAAAFAAGRRDDVRRDLAEQMSAAAGKLQFEVAAGLKSRLDRLAELDSPRYALAAPIEQLRYLSVQRGAGVGRARVFVCDRGRLEPGADVAFPPEPGQMQAVLEAAAPAGDRPGPCDRFGLGLMASYLFAGANKRGFWVRLDEIAGPAALGEAIEGAAEALGLRASRRKAKAKRKAEPSDAPGRYNGPVPENGDAV